MSTTALGLIKGALRRVNAYQSGEAIAAWDEQDCLETLNDMLDSWSTDKISIYGSNENIVYFVAGQNTYTIGNPTNAQLGLPNFLGSATGTTITSLNVPSQLIAGSSILTGSTITDLQNLIPAGTYVTGVGTNTITISQPATGISVGNDTFYFTVPGNFGFPRPLRITFGFTRFNQLDFEFDVHTSLERFNEILYKAQPGPWPVAAWYNPLMPYGQIKFFQTPGNAGECHLFTDTILGNLTLNQTVVMPQGYTRAIKWCLAKELCAEFGYPITEAIKSNADEAFKLIKALNAQPAQVSRYDNALVRPRGDYGWIFSGGY